MITDICYALFYIAEAITCYIFFENLYTRKTAPDYGKYRVYVMFPLTTIISYAVSFLKTPVLNLAVFAVTTLAIALVCYKIRFGAAVFMTAMLVSFMLLSELCMIFLGSAVFELLHFAYTDNIFVLIAQAGLSKLIYFLLAYSVSRILAKRGQFLKTEKYVFPLAFLPVTTVLVILFVSVFVADGSEKYTYLVSISTVLLILANIIVFIVYYYVQRTNSENTFLQLEQQKNNARLEYYEMLMSQSEDRNILIHDIKHHLLNIEALSIDGKNDAVTSYIGKIKDEFGLSENVHYSGNRILDVIINRYRMICRQQGIEFSAETGNIPTDFMNEVDLTALLDNVLQNAVESAVRSEKKYVSFSAFRVNSNFMKMLICNACDSAPDFDKEGNLRSRKKGKNHGWGTKSVARVMKKYNGDVKYTYDDEKKTFECELVLKH